MIPISGIGNVAGPLPGRQAGSRSQTPTVDATPLKDDLFISDQASVVARYLTDANKDSQIRTERVEAAKQQIRENAYKVEGVVQQVVSRIINLL